MPIPTYEGSVTVSGVGASTTPNIGSIDGGSPPSVGDLILLHITRATASTTADQYVDCPEDWHNFGHAQNGLVDIILWKIWQSGDDTTPTFSWAFSESIILTFHCIRGVDQSRPICRQSIRRYSDSNFVWLAETTPVANCLALALSSCDDDRAGSSAPGGWTERTDEEVNSSNDITQYAMTQGFASASSSTGTASMDIGGGGTEDIISRMILLQEPQTVTPKSVFIKSGSLQSPTSTGVQNITGLGFAAKAVIFHCTRSNSTTVQSGNVWTQGIGADDGVTTAAQWSSGFSLLAGAGGGFQRSGEAICLHVGNGATPALLASYSRIADGFSLNWTAVEGTSWTVNWIAFGGDDLRAAAVSEICSGSPLTGLPWRPHFAHVIGQGWPAAGDNWRDSVAFMIGMAGWLDCQTGSSWTLMADNNGSQPIRPNVFYGQNAGGGVTYELEFQQTTSDGWTWSGTNGDFFFALAFHIVGGGTWYPFQVETIRADDTGTNGVDQTLPSFALGQDLYEKRLIHNITAREDTSITGSTGGAGQGHTLFRGPAVQDADALAFMRNFGTEQTRRQPDDSYMQGIASINPPERIGAHVDPETIDWSVNSTNASTIGLFTIGQLKLPQPVFVGAPF